MKQLTQPAKDAVIEAYRRLYESAQSLERVYTEYPELNELQPVRETAQVLPMSIDDWGGEIAVLISAWSKLDAAPKRARECPVSLRGCFSALSTGGDFRKPSAAEKHAYTCQPDTEIWSTPEGHVDVLWYPSGDESGDKPIFYVIDRLHGAMWTIELNGRILEVS